MNVSIALSSRARHYLVELEEDAGPSPGVVVLVLLGARPHVPHVHLAHLARPRRQVVVALDDVVAGAVEVAGLVVGWAKERARASRQAAGVL